MKRQAASVGISGNYEWSSLGMFASSNMDESNQIVAIDFPVSSGNVKSMALGISVAQLVVRIHGVAFGSVLSDT